MPAPWDTPCQAEGCDRTATHRVYDHPDVKGSVCNAHLPSDHRGECFALND